MDLHQDDTARSWLVVMEYVCVCGGAAYSSGIFLEERELGRPPPVGHTHIRLLLLAHGDPRGVYAAASGRTGEEKRGDGGSGLLQPTPVCLAARDQKTVDPSRLGLPMSMGHPTLCSLQDTVPCLVSRQPSALNTFLTHPPEPHSILRDSERLQIESQGPSIPLGNISLKGMS